MDVAQHRSPGSAIAVAVPGVAGLTTWAVLAPRTELSSHLQTGWAAAAALVPALATAALLAWRLPRHGITRVLSVHVLAHVLVLASGVAAEHGTGTPAVDDLLLRVSGAAWAGTLPLLPVLVLLFPTGRPGSRAWRRVLDAQLAAVGVLLVLSLTLVPPQGDPSGAVQVVAAGCAVVLVASGVAAAVRLAVGWRRLASTERARQRLFVVLALLLAAGYLVGDLLSALVPLPDLVTADLTYAFLVGGLPTAVGVSVLRHRLFGLEVVLHRALLASAAGACLLVAYVSAAVAVAALGGPEVGEPASALLPALVVVAVLAPLTAVLRRAVDRLLYGDRSQPQRALRRLAERLAAAPAPSDVPDLVVRTVVESLRLPWARVDVDDEGVPRPLAAAGTRGTGEVVTVPLVRRGERVGGLAVELRPGEARLASADVDLLDAVAAQAAAALEALQLTEELLRSRERLVQTREAERARLRRDLHDDLSPALAGMVLALDAGRRLLRRDPGAADALLGRVSDSAGSCGDVVRRLLADLSPPGLAEVGLLAAVEDCAARLHRPGEFEVVVEVAQPLPPVSEAVEVAAYRIVGEALSNAARHAAAQRCTLRLAPGSGDGGSVDGDLVVEVRDDGRGLGTVPAPAGDGCGLGLPSMRERARDVGGTLDVVSAPGRGTTVCARLPALPTQVTR